MRSFVVAIAASVSLVFATIAFAEDAAPPSPPAAPLAPKLANGQGNNCAGQYYPALAVRLNHEGAVVLLVHIDEKGMVTGADIAQSSGWPELDDASKQCVTNNWHFTPATQDGKPVASNKQYRIVWKLGAPTYAPQVQTGPEIACSAIFSDAKPRWPNYHSALLHFRISTGGVVEHPFIAVSSGDELFDAKAVQCLLNVRYTSAAIENAATEVSWNAALRWSPHTGLAYADASKLGPYCADNFFPASIWKGDPAGDTLVSFHIVQGGAVSKASIEKTSGNSDLDAAALKCVGVWRFASFAHFSSNTDVGELVRFSWHEGHAFVLLDPPG